MNQDAQEFKEVSQALEALRDKLNKVNLELDMALRNGADRELLETLRKNRDKIIKDWNYLYNKLRSIDRPKAKPKATGEARHDDAD